MRYENLVNIKERIYNRLNSWLHQGISGGSQNPEEFARQTLFVNIEFRELSGGTAALGCYDLSRLVFITFPLTDEIGAKIVD